MQEWGGGKGRRGGEAEPIFCPASLLGWDSLQEDSRRGKKNFINKKKGEGED